MKQAHVRYFKNNDVEMIILRTLSEVFDYIQMISGNTINTLHHLLHNQIPIERWDHYASKGDWGNSFNIAMMEVDLIGGNPIYTVDKWTQEKLKNLSTMILNGETILVNSNGGYCPFDPKMHEILEIYDFEPVARNHYKINENTQYLNLENDYELENRTIEYLTPLDKNFSYICGLRDYSKASWLNIFRQFKLNGGHTVYVYTTGSDVVQMFEYGQCIIEAEIKNVIFEFNAGMTKEILENINHLKASDINVKVLEENKNVELS